MAGIKTVLEGDSRGLVSAMNKGEKSAIGVGKSMDAARKQVEAFDKAARRNSLEQYDASLRKTVQATTGVASASNVASKATAGLKGNIGSANGVAMEFNRIIQDAPFGIMGVGNNITQLTDNFGRLKTQTGSTGAALKATFASMLTGANLLSLGISAAVTGLTLWQMHSRKANKETKELEDGTKTYIDTLKGLEQATAKGQESAQKDLTNLKLLYEATQNLTIPMDARRRAADELIKQYPKQFEGLTTEAVLAGKASTAYDKLTKSITATATAAAYANKMTENAQKQLNNYLQILDKQNRLNDVQAKLKPMQGVIDDTSGTASQIAARRRSVLTEATKLRYEEIRLQKEINELGKQNSGITKENSLLQGNYNSQLADGADVGGKVNGKLKKVKETTDDITKLTNTLQGTVMSELDRKVFEVENKYKSIFDTIKKITNASKQADAFGLATQAKQAELLRLETERMLYLTKGVFTEAKIKTTTGGSPYNTSTLPGIDKAQTRINKAAISNLSKDWEKSVEEMSKNLNRAVQSFGRNFTKTLSNINRDADATFRSVFASLSSSLILGIGDVLQQGLLKGLGDLVNKSMINLGKNGTKWAAGLGVAGSAISGISKPTSGIGQAAGGALSGAGAGMAIGSIVPGVGTVIGAGVGAIVGAIGGIFSSSAAKKQEKIREQQLAEQRRQTSLIEYQNALAYQNDIIGQMTSNGFVTGFDRSATGELVAKVSGQDLLFIMERARGKR
ncbi:hypothetical protein ORI89_18835 [Sphingobacterium sp. UT-1RO-CII-1]|uniref:hypothetical protein n=1 Tax=Sphingobacterium sp. UT-1RO-CII-1 TaxID=2995225 RepID=UPI00227C76B1|nr:hypothetical protein [Sphingobacterium sp. UT-1RO-CII-1]MCY4781714.1 hypothetical protein [Sphingobacterium sp. UT-1RO-CII-1]